jgi:serine O-acetyltransferase
MIDTIKEDFKNNSFRSFLILFLYRITNSAYVNRNYIQVKIINIIFFIVKVVFSIQSQISYKAKIGRNIRLPHVGFGVVVSSKAKIGDNVTIYHLVTIGINERKCTKKNEVCVEIEDNCYISVGAKIISSKIGKNSIIGPNAVVYKNIPPNSIILNEVIIK